MSNNFLEYLKGIPKSLYFNIKYFGLKKGIMLPILLSSKVKLLKMKGKIEICDSYEFGMIKIGFPSCGIFDYTYSRSIWQVEGVVRFEGRASLGQGSKLAVGKKGKLEFGNCFIVTGETQFICYKKIKFGSSCLVSWHNLFIDTDFHKIIKNNFVVNEDKEIIIKDNVWIGSRCTVLKGSQISKNIIVASNSVIVKKYLEENIIIAGNPGKKVKDKVIWDY